MDSVNLEEVLHNKCIYCSVICPCITIGLHRIIMKMTCSAGFPFILEICSFVF